MNLFKSNFKLLALSLVLSVASIGLSALQWHDAGALSLVGVHNAVSSPELAARPAVATIAKPGGVSWLKLFAACTAIGALLTAPFDAPQRDGEFLSIPVEANTQLYSGGIIAKDANGYAVPANDAAGLTVIGRCEEGVNNNAEQWNNYQYGPAAAVNVRVRRGVFAYNNSAVDPVAGVDVGNVVFVENDSTINKTGGVNKIVAGRLLGIDPVTAAVWVDFRDKAVTVA